MGSGISHYQTKEAARAAGITEVEIDEYCEYIEDKIRLKIVRQEICVAVVLPSEDAKKTKKKQSKANKKANKKAAKRVNQSPSSPNAYRVDAYIAKLKLRILLPINSPRRRTTSIIP